MTRWKIGIPIPTSNDSEYNRRSWPMYAAAVQQAGGIACEIPLHLGEPKRSSLGRECAGIILPGSPSDVDPRRYGQEAIAACAPADPLREEADRSLLEECYRTGKPLLGVCYGAQSLNVWRGGTLVQHLACAPVNHVAGAAVAVAHSTVVAGNLAGKVDAGEVVEKCGEFRLPVNSSHHQAIGALGSGLRICAVSPEDGVVEAVEGDGSDGTPAFLLGVQWHPERSVDLSGTSRALFRGLIDAALVWERNHLSLAAPH